MKLSQVIAELETDAIEPRRLSVDPEVTAIAYDSRQVTPGAVFVAIEGFATDGHRFIPQAVQNGAVAVVCSKPATADVPVVCLANPRAALARLACRFYDRPADEVTLVGVTGTSGKTTVTYLLEQILQKAGCRPGVVGTINCRFAGTVLANPVTTPESVDLQKILRQMVNQGISHVVMEVSSHALDLNRVDGCLFDAAVFTNLSHDHLDYHGTTEAYWASKQKLFFDYLKPVNGHHPKRAVVNANDPHGQQLAQSLGPSALRVAVKGKGDIMPLAVSVDLSGLRGRLATPAGEIALASSLVGEFNLENILSAAGAALILGLSPQAIEAGIAATPSIPGRLERIAEGGQRTIFVDYAHKPDALDNAITALRRLTSGRLITVFGCGGDRDQAKRPVMGEIAARLSDLAVVTSDNPRSEDPLAIISQIETGVRRVCAHRLAAETLAKGWQGRAYVVEPDRLAAIAAAIQAARNHDSVLIAGKGHETYQILKDHTIAFDDREAARRVLAEMNEQGA